MGERRARKQAVRGAGKVAAALLAILGAIGCGAPAESADQEYRIAGGGTTGVYYSYGDQLAGALRDGLDIDISVAETEGSVDNLLRVGSGDALLGFAQGDAAADAIAGAGAFDEPLTVQAVGRVYDEYVHIVVPEGSDVRRIADLAGRRVSLGAENSGVQVIATRVLDASGVDIDEIDNPSLGPDASIEALLEGEIDGFFWVGGLPTPGVEQLAEAMPIRLLPIGPGTVEQVNAGHAGVYGLSDFPVGTYGIETPIETMTVPNYLIVAEEAPPDLVHDVTRVLFESRSAITAVVPAAQFLDRRQAIFTAPVELHPGAARYYVETRR